MPFVSANIDAARVQQLERLQRDYEEKSFRNLFELSHLHTGWEHGFIESMAIETRLGLEGVTALANAKAARFLRGLELCVTQRERRSSWDDPAPTTDPLPFLAANGLPKTLRSLYVSMALETYEPHSADLSVIWPHVPELVELVIIGNARDWSFRETPNELGVLDFPKLETLTVEDVDEPQLRELARARLPALEKLVIENASWPSLHLLDDLALMTPIELCIRRNRTPHEAAQDFDAIARSRLLMRARRIDFTASVGAETADAFVAVAPRLPRTAEVVIHGVSLDPIRLARLGEIFGARLVVV